MNLLRSLLFLVTAVVWTAPFGLLVTLSIILPMPMRFAIVTIWRRVFMLIVRVVLGIRYEVVGREHIPDAPAVILSKHQSAWETVALQEVFAPHRLLFVLKKELLKLPFLGWAFVALRMISIDRQAGLDALAQVVQQGRERLQSGYWVVVFPEGTRVAPGQKRRFKIGGAHLAVHTGTRVIPVAHNAGEVWPRNALVKRPGLVTVSIGPPIDPEGMSESMLNAKVEAWIEAEMRRLSPHRYPEASHPAPAS